MSDIAIRLEGIGKRYQIVSARTKNDRMTYVVARALTMPVRIMARLTQGSQNGTPKREFIWALKDVGLEIKHGEIVGIIGRNGAGKSTMLKILSRITEPTTGWAEVRGRVGSLLEVGTGFHPELTGRENVFLNGTILGMRRAEIAGKFDEIVSFAELEKFVDTPVKYYSTGMFLRLAFAVAAHLQSEILLVDEVLAVGDARFQKRCLNKMEDAGKQGRTVLFVSHNMPAIMRLCPRAILLDDGNVVGDGPSHQVAGAYLHTGFGTRAFRQWEPATAPGRDVARLCAVRVRSNGGAITDAVDIRRTVEIEMEYDVLQPGQVLLPNFGIFNDQGVCLFDAPGFDRTWRGRARPAGRWLSKVTIPGNFFAEGTHFVHAGMLRLDPVVEQFSEYDAVAFQVIDSLDGDSARGDWGGKVSGVVRPLFDWSTTLLAPAGEPHEQVTG